MYCREYQLTQPGCYSQGSTPHLRVNEEPIGKSLSYGASPINGFVFDSFLEYSLGDVPSATAALWPLTISPDD